MAKRDVPISQQPKILYEASIARMDDCYSALDRRSLPLAFYLAGLSVECILQAVAKQTDPTHDARHDLSQWANKCPISFQNALTTPKCREHWSAGQANWHNGIRYYSWDGLLGYLRKKGLLRPWKGDDEAKMIQATKAFVASAEIIREKGLQQWISSK